MEADAKKIFSLIYSTNFWQSPESKSGSGSELRRTIHARREIAYLIQDLNIKTLLDAPCGDFHWMQHVNLSSVNYLGIDIVDAMIETNQNKYSKENIQFKVLDLANDNLPRVDLILCRACLYHFPNHYIKRTINNFKKSGATYLLTTNHSWHLPESNQDILMGDFRRINLEQSPFLLPPPLRTIVEGNDEGAFEDTVLGLWELDKINYFND